MISEYTNLDLRYCDFLQAGENYMDRNGSSVR